MNLFESWDRLKKRQAWCLPMNPGFNGDILWIYSGMSDGTVNVKIP